MQGRMNVKKLIVLFWNWGSPIRKTHRVAFTCCQTPAATYCGGSTVHSSTVISALTCILLPTGAQGPFAHAV